MNMIYLPLQDLLWYQIHFKVFLSLLFHFCEKCHWRFDVKYFHSEDSVLGRMNTNFIFSAFGVSPVLIIFMILTHIY